MITLESQGDLITICRDGLFLLGVRTPTALPGIIAQAAGGVLTYDEARGLLRAVSYRYPETARACSIVRNAIDAKEAQAELLAVLDNTDAPQEDERDAKIAALEKELDAYKAERTWANRLIRRRDQENIPAWGRLTERFGLDWRSTPEQVAVAVVERLDSLADVATLQAKNAALEAENAALRQRIAEMESKGGGA